MRSVTWYCRTESLQSSGFPNWNGMYLNTSQPVLPGVYLYRFEVDGRAVARKMVIVR